MSEKVNDFQVKVKAEMSGIKKTLYKEEAWSALMASLFAANACFVVFFPFSIVSLINIWAAMVMLKQFKPTVKKQFILHKHMETLKASMKEKVWTPKD